VPAIYSDSFFVKIGGLAFYGPDRTDLFRRSAGYVDRILRGGKPGDLPFQQPTKYELMVNRTAAKALSLELSPASLVLADERSTNETSPQAISASGRGAATLPAVARFVSAQAYPSRPVRCGANRVGLSQTRPTPA
jgi:ABC transporter substrate binding protein